MDLIILTNIVLNKFSRLLLRCRNLFYEKFLCDKFCIVKYPPQELSVLAKIKEKTWETNYAPPIFECAKEREVTALYPEQYIYLIKNGRICMDSDIVLFEDCAYWDKYNTEDFVTCAVPSDRNVFSFNNDYVYIKKQKKEICLKGRIFSMLGVWSYAYSHFLFQFLCKLYYTVENGFFDDEIILLTNPSGDKNIEEIFNKYLLKYPNVKRVCASKDTIYKCEDLIFVPSLGNNYNECKFYLDYRFMTPSSVVNGLQNFLVSPLVEKVRNRSVKYKKIFLPRTNNRILNNNNEVEDYFRNQGFHFLDCGNLSLEDKADIFSHAEEIVAVHGSSLMNLIFCENARCMVMVNNRYINELLPYTLSRMKVKAFLHVGGFDDDSDRRSNFTIPINKVKRAYHQLIQGEFDINKS